MKRLDLCGRQFDRLTVVGPSGYDRTQKKFVWECRCQCGTTVRVITNSLTRGNTRSCGCLERDVVIPKLRASRYDSTRHGHAARSGRSLTYSSWMSMMSRCRNPQNPRWQDYGGRGITIDARWDDFMNFLDDMGPRPSKDYSIDRMDCDGHYTKSNCRWATRSQQQLNRRDRRKEA